MKQYFEYMDNIKASDTLHQRLLNLETPKKRPAAWKKYGAVAAALVIVAGAGVWALDQSRPLHNFVDEVYVPIPELANIGQPDIALEDPNETAEPGMKTDGGYEISDGEMTAYFFLPYIEYGMAENVTQMSVDWDLPAGSTRRDLTQADIDALFGNGKNLSDHLGWGGHTLTGWAGWYEDGSFWGLFINGYKGPLDHFELAFTAGNTYPPSCIGYGDGVVNELWNIPVTAYGHGGEHGCDRRVEFLKDGYGFRFDITGSDVEKTSNIVSRVTRWLIVEGLKPDAVTADGAVTVHPQEADPNYSVGEPNWEDGVPEEDNTSAYNPGADMAVTAPPEEGETSAYDPDETMETRSPGC